MHDGCFFNIKSFSSANQSGTIRVKRRYFLYSIIVTSCPILYQPSSVSSSCSNILSRRRMQCGSYFTKTNCPCEIIIRSFHCEVIIVQIIMGHPPEGASKMNRHLMGVPSFTNYTISRTNKSFNRIKFYICLLQNHG